MTVYVGVWRGMTGISNAMRAVRPQALARLWETQCRTNAAAESGAESDERDGLVAFMVAGELMVKVW